jgi:hypothetical protein
MLALVKEKKLAAVEAEIAAERAAALSLSEGKLRRTLSALKTFDPGMSGRRTRAQLVDEAADACLAYVVQREAMGIGAHNMRTVLAEYRIPDEVWNRMGATQAG